MVKNIIFVFDYAYVDGGAANVAIQSAVALAEQYRVCFFAAVGPVCDALKESRVEVTCLDQQDINHAPFLKAAKNGVWNSSAKRAFKKFLSDFSPEDTVVHIHGWTKALSASVLSQPAKMGFKTVLTLHDFFPICPNGGLYHYVKNVSCEKKPMSLGCVLCNCDKRNYLQKLYRVIRQMPTRRFFKKAKNLTLLYISEFSYLKLKPWLNPSIPCLFVRNPYELGDAALYRAEENLNYCFLGRVCPEKGVDLFCRAASSLLKEGRLRGKAIVIGDGETRAELEAQYPEVEFAGWKTHEEVASYIREARALVFPSKIYETAGLTPIEFMAHGIPCIIADNCAARDYLDKENTGLLFQSGNAEDLREKLLLAEDDAYWSVVAKTLRETFRPEEYSIAAHMEALLAVYEGLLGAD